MLPTEIAYFTGTLFLALIVLIKWKRRRDLIAARLNRGLRGYVAAGGRFEPAEPEYMQAGYAQEEEEDGPIVA